MSYDSYNMPIEQAKEIALRTGQLLLTQDGRCTMEPMFCVQGRRRIFGMDTKWTDNYVWINTEEDTHECEAPADGEETDHIQKSGYVDVWETLMVALTEEGCKEHLRLNGHNYRHFEEVRIYVESFRRCPEMIAIRCLLMNMAKEKVNG